MKHIALLAVIGAGLMALPSTAAAQLGEIKCPNGADVRVRTAPPSLYVCAFVVVAGYRAGGEFEVNNSNGCTYVNGWETNPGTPGYAGICTGTTSRGPSCATTGNGGANTGGCFEIKPAPAPVNQALNTFPVGLVTASFICGNTSGEDPGNTTRDGCSIP